MHHAYCTNVAKTILFACLSSKGKASSAVVTVNIGAGASKFFGVKRISAQIFRNLPKKLSCKFCRPFLGVTSKKWSSLPFLQTLGGIFEVKQGWAPVLHRFSGILFRFSGIFPGFSGIFPRFLEILPGFLTNQYFWGCACTPCTPVSYTTMLQDVGNSIRYSRNESSVNGFMLAGCYEWQKVQQNIKLKDSKPLFRCSYD